MIIIHEISKQLINSYCSLEMINAFGKLIGVQSELNMRVFHEWDTLTNMRKIEIKHRSGAQLYVLTMPEWIASDSFRGPASVRPDVLAARDIVSWLKTKAEEDAYDTLLRVKNDKREIAHDIVEQLVTNTSKEVAGI